MLVYLPIPFGLFPSLVAFDEAPVSEAEDVPSLLLFELELHATAKTMAPDKIDNRIFFRFIIVDFI